MIRVYLPLALLTVSLVVGAAPWMKVYGHVSGQAKTLHQATMTLVDAQQLCDKLAGCKAITMESEPVQGATILIYFKNDAHVHDSTWVTYAHPAADKRSGSAHAPPGFFSRVASSISRSVAGFLTPKPKPKIVSEPEPDEKYTGDVVNVVGDTFAQIVHDDNKDVLVNMYAPWCGYSQAFKPKYQALARQLKHVSTLTIAQMDATQNFFPGVHVRGFPSVLLFPARRKSNVVEYHGNRSPESMVDWLHQTAAHKDFPDNSADVDGGSLGANEHDET